MRVSEFINKLKELQDEHGDLRITHYDFNFSVSDHNGPVIKDIRAKRKREIKTNYTDYSDRVSIEKVIHI